MSFSNNLNASTDGTTYSNVVAKTNLTNTTTPVFTGTSVKGSAIQFNNDYFLSLPPEICLNLYAGSISVWVRPDNVGSTTIFGLQVDGQNSYGFLTIGMYNNGGGTNVGGTSMKVYFRCKNEGQLYTANNVLSNQEYAHIVVNWNNSSNVGNMYINKNLVFSSPALNTNDFIHYTGSATGCFIGHWYSGSGQKGTPFKGQMDEFKLFPRNLSVLEINELYNKR
jgi:hypothetical protein